MALILFILAIPALLMFAGFWMSGTVPHVSVGDYDGVNGVSLSGCGVQVMPPKQYMIDAICAAEGVYLKSGLPAPRLVEPGWYVYYPLEISTFGSGWHRCSAKRAAEILAKGWHGVKVAEVKETYVHQ